MGYGQAPVEKDAPLRGGTYKAVRRAERYEIQKEFGLDGKSSKTKSTFFVDKKDLRAYILKDLTWHDEQQLYSDGSTNVNLKPAEPEMDERVCFQVVDKRQQLYSMSRYVKDDESLGSGESLHMHEKDLETIPKFTWNAYRLKETTLYIYGEFSGEDKYVEIDVSDAVFKQSNREVTFYQFRKSLCSIPICKLQDMYYTSNGSITLYTNDGCVVIPYRLKSIPKTYERFDLDN